MKTLAFSLAFGLLATGAAFAQGMSDLDADGSGTLTLAEMQAVYTTLTEEGFNAIDTNADGVVDETELAAATDTGALPATE